MDVASGTLISYATKDGNVAIDGDGKNSPYTEALLKYLDNREDDFLYYIIPSADMAKMLKNRIKFGLIRQVEVVMLISLLICVQYIYRLIKA